MKNLVVSIIAICSLSALCAQTPLQIRERLSSAKAPKLRTPVERVSHDERHVAADRQPSIRMTPEGSLEVRPDNSSREALTTIAAQKRSHEVMGYRVGFFFDNSQDARANAEEAKDKFEQHFSVPVYMVYDSPYYKVSAGDCLTEDEAIVLFEHIRPIFPNAYVMRERMEIKDFIIDESKPLTPLMPVDSIEREARAIESSNLLGN